MQAFSEAADGIRTHDLLHGKQNVCFRLGADIACKCAGSRVKWHRAIPRRSTRNHGVLGTQWAPGLTSTHITEDARQVHFRVSGLEAVL